MAMVTLNLAPTTPEWLSAWGAKPMELGLDLCGGVHFKLEVDTEAAIKQRREFYEISLKRKLREDRIRGRVSTERNTIQATFRSEEHRESARAIISENHPELSLDRIDQDDMWIIRATLVDQTIKEIVDYAVSQNLTTLRNRVNELGVSEPLVRVKGKSNCSRASWYPDTAEAKRILAR